MLGFKKFPKSISTSVNNVACHGVPDERPLENGDIVSVDVNVYKNGFHGVCGSTYVIGDAKNNPMVRYLRSVAEECLFKGRYHISIKSIYFSNIRISIYLFNSNYKISF